MPTVGFAGTAGADGVTADSPRGSRESSCSIAASSILVKRISGFPRRCPSGSGCPAHRSHPCEWTEPGNPSIDQRRSEAAGTTGAINTASARQTCRLTLTVVAQREASLLAVFHGSLSLKYLL